MIKNIIIILSLFSAQIIFAASPLFSVVAKDGSGDYTTVQSALDACPDNTRCIVFIKNGVYDEQVTLGSKTATSLKKISLIGESAPGVIITHAQSRASSGSPTFEDVCTVKFYATDLYVENITIQNTAGNTGMAEALYTAGDRQTFKNCRILGYQDTYRSKKGTRAYFIDCWLEGAVDFIYAGGTVYFENCTLNCVKGGGYIVAPEDAFATIPAASTTIGKFLRLGFIFQNCKITANSDVVANSYSLGRPWNTYAGTFYLNCKLGSHIKPAGWTTMGGNETTSCFAEYNSMDINGNPIDILSRISWSFQLPKVDVDNLLTATKFFSTGYTTVYSPTTYCEAPSKPVNISRTNNTLSWPSVTNAIGYLIYKNDIFFGSTAETSFSVDSNSDYYIKALSATGATSLASEKLTDITNPTFQSIVYKYENGILQFSTSVSLKIFNLNGALVYSNSNFSSHFEIKELNKGIYILEFKDYDGGIIRRKLLIENSFFK